MSWRTGAFLGALNHEYRLNFGIRSADIGKIDNRCRCIDFANTAWRCLPYSARGFFFGALNTNIALIWGSDQPILVKSIIDIDVLV